VLSPRESDSPSAGVARIRRAELAGELVDVRIAGGRIASVESHRPGREAPAPPGESVLDARGGALLPGLHDHHLHLLALASALDSVRCGPPAVRDARGLAAALAAAAPRRGWIRGVGYHESVAGPLERPRLDALAPSWPTRVQHRSGAAWFLNSRAIEALGLDAGQGAPGVERDARGRATGVLHGADAWLRERLPGVELPDLAPVGALLAGFGTTGVTDATPDNGPETLDALGRARVRGDLPQDVLVMGGAQLPEPRAEGLARGPRKILLREAALPELPILVGWIAEAHAAGRAAAIHCVTRAELVLAAVALREAGPLPGDRVEHGAIVPPDALPLLAGLGVTVVTQPNFVRERGDAYLREVAPADRPWLYRCAGLLAGGVPIGGGTDAPFGHPDPWRAMQAAVDRRSEAGAVLGADESLSPERALALFLSPPDAPGAAPRRVAPGAPADLCLLERPWKQARDRLDSGDVVAALRRGRILPTHADGASG
jgi:predicted amidohydrolase YtcJ